MPAARIIEAVDVLKDAGFGLVAGFPIPASDRLGLNRLEERLDNGVDTKSIVAWVRPSSCGNGHGFISDAFAQWLAQHGI